MWGLNLKNHNPWGILASTSKTPAFSFSFCNFHKNTIEGPKKCFSQNVAYSPRWIPHTYTQQSNFSSRIHWAIYKTRQADMAAPLSMERIFFTSFTVTVVRFEIELDLCKSHDTRYQCSRVLPGNGWQITHERRGIYLLNEFRIRLIYHTWRVPRIYVGTVGVIYLAGVESADASLQSAGLPGWIVNKTTKVCMMEQDFVSGRWILDWKGNRQR